MDAHSFKGKPIFFWQGLLILLPVGLLATVGFLSLRKDRLLTEHQAMERAQTVAEALLPRLWSELMITNLPAGPAQFAFEVDSAGSLLFPPAFAPSPSPEAFDLTALTPDQVRLWVAAQSTEAAEQDPAAGVRAYRDFLASNPPARFVAAAHYSVGLLCAKAGNASAAEASFETILEKYPAAVGESGLPLQPLTILQLLGLAKGGKASWNPKRAALLDAICSNAVARPNSVSAEILGRVDQWATTPEARAAIGKWHRTWDDQQAARELFSAVAPRFREALAASRSSLRNPNPRLFWFASAAPEQDSGRQPETAFHLTSGAVLGEFAIETASPETGVEATNRNWLALRVERASTNQCFVCLREQDLGSRLTATVEGAGHVPDYFGIGLEVAGRRLTWPAAPDLRMWRLVEYMSKGGGGLKKEYLPETATRVLAVAAQKEAGLEQLKVSIFLTSPSVLFAREQVRLFWFGALIATAAAAALAGFLAAYRAFHRQLRLSELKSNFVSSVSHELRAPIASVRLMAESLERGKVPEASKQKEYFRFIGQECRRLSSLIENVLDFSRIEQGRKQYEFEPTDLVALTQQTVKLMETYAGERGIRLALILPDAQTSTLENQLSLDGKAIQQALVNLIDNALKHSPKGQTVTVGLEYSTDMRAGADPPAPESDAAGGVRLWVEDHGEGIPRAEHEKIFERFYRRGSELRRETQGVGIGLSLVKHIVEAHDGRVLVRSEVGQGSRFTIELPFGHDH